MLVVLADYTFADCGKDKFAPCTCSDASKGSTITCNRVPVATVKTMFSKVKQYSFDYLVITPNSKDTIIPAGLIGNHTFGGLTINCPNRFTPLMVDPMAFTLTGVMTAALTVKNCDLSKLDWSFIKSFNSMTDLTVTTSSNLHTMFYTFPSSNLNDLYRITLTFITGMNGFANASLKYPPILQAELEKVEISYCYDLTDAALDRLLTKWIVPSGKDSIEELTIIGNSLTTIPLNLPAMDGLYKVDFSNNMQPLSLQNGDFDFTNANGLQPIQFLLMDNSLIYYIEPGTFKGQQHIIF